MFNRIRNKFADMVEIYPETYFEHQSENDKKRFRDFNIKQQKLINFLRPA